MNIRKFVYLNWGERYEGMTAHKERYEDMSAQLEQLRIIRTEKKKKKIGLYWIQTHDLCDTGAMLYHLSYQASIKPTGSWLLCEFVIYPWMWKNTSLCERSLI